MNFSILFGLWILTLLTYFNCNSYLLDCEIDCWFCQVVVIAGGVDTTATETKGNILIHRTEQVLSAI